MAKKRIGSLMTICILLLLWSCHTPRHLVSADYLANGGDQLDFLIDLPHKNLNAYYRDALIESAKNQKEIAAKIEGRIKYIDHK